MAGRTNSVSAAAMISRPITTVGRRRCTSAPVPVAIALETEPGEATSSHQHRLHACQASIGNRLIRPHAALEPLPNGSHQGHVMHI